MSLLNCTLLDTVLEQVVKLPIHTRCTPAEAGVGVDISDVRDRDLNVIEAAQPSQQGGGDEAHTCEPSTA